MAIAIKWDGTHRVNRVLSNETFEVAQGLRLVIINVKDLVHKRCFYKFLNCQQIK